MVVHQLQLVIGVKIKEVGQSAGTRVGDVAKDAKENVADVAEKFGSVFKSKWSLFQQPATKHAMQERLLSAAASTGFLLRRGLSETKDKVAIGKTKVEEVAKKTAQKSKTILSDIERWQKGVASSDVFGLPIEVTVQGQPSTRPIPCLLVRCADYLISSGLSTPYLFKSEGDKKVNRELVSLYNQEPNAVIPEGTKPLDVAALIKCYLSSLPKPLVTFDLYDSIRAARSDIDALKNILKRLPNMDSQCLSEEMAPLIMWQKGRRPEIYKELWHHQTGSPFRKNPNSQPAPYPWDLLEDNEEDASSSIPLDEETPIDYGAVEVIHCLVQHHNAVFTDANELEWSSSSESQSRYWSSWLPTLSSTPAQSSKPLDFLAVISVLTVFSFCSNPPYKCYM
ncbi:putative Rho GTPase-activating protein [Drosera capensis]